MRIGILSDVHEANDRLRAAVRGLEALGVDRFVFLGDALENGDRIEETWEILRATGARGVWGNHELGLCHDPSRRLREKYAAVLGDFADLQPFVVLEDARFSHTAPWEDATDPVAFFTDDEDPCDPEVFSHRVESLVERLFLMGHRHRWRAVSDRVDLSTWRGRAPLDLSETGRTLINVHAVTEGWCGLLDTSANVFEPVSIDG